MKALFPEQKGWKNKATDEVISWAEYFANAPIGPAAYINLDSWIPAPIQLKLIQLRLWLERLIS